MTASIRDQILDYLHQNHSASVAAMAVALKVTKNDIRYHLKFLIAERLVEIVPNHILTSSKERGRPKAVYQLTSTARANNYQKMASSLLALYFSNKQVMPDEAAGDLARLMFAYPEDEDQTLIQRLNLLLDQLREHNYAPRWEAHSGGPRVIFENCPYAGILADFPQLCEMDRQFVYQFTDLKTDLLQTINSSKRKPPACIFRLKAP